MRTQNALNVNPCCRRHPVRTQVLNAHDDVERYSENLGLRLGRNIYYAEINAALGYGR